MGSRTELEAAIERLVDASFDATTKALPFDGPTCLRDVGERGWNLFAGDLPLPVLAIDLAAVDHNVGRMQAVADACGAWLAPHAKTTMAPQIWARQLAAGAWGLTVATPIQLQVAAAFGVPRVIFANEPVTPYEFRLITELVRRGQEVYVLADAPGPLARLADAAQAAGLERPLPVLVELGISGGRTGVRGHDQLLALAALVDARRPWLRLAGVEMFETTATMTGSDDPVNAVDRVLDGLASAALALLDRRIADGSRDDPEPFIVTAGGSGYFDRVVEVVGRRLPPDAQLVLRPGTYVTHDSGMYERLSPLGSGPNDRMPGERLRPALTLWSSVLSRPEPQLAILNIGRRDSPSDGDAPVARWFVPSGEGARPLPFPAPATVAAMNDHHLFLRVEPTAEIGPGDIVGLGVSHPCLVMDRWPVLLATTDDGAVVDAIATFF